MTKEKDYTPELLRDLHERKKPSQQLEGRIIEDLKKEGLIENIRKMRIQKITWIAASFLGVLFAFFAGLQWEKLQSNNTMTDNQKYLLLLYEDGSFDFGEQSINEVINEYSNWAIEQDKEGRLVSAEKLKEETFLMGNISESKSSVTGYFIIVAEDDEKAREIAKSHPHLKYEGGIELRSIDNI